MGAANQNLCGTRGQYRVRLYAPANYSYGQLRIAKELARRKRCFPPLVLRCSSGGPPPGIPTLHGRALLETDRDGTPLVAVVNGVWQTIIGKETRSANSPISIPHEARSR